MRKLRVAAAATSLPTLGAAGSIATAGAATSGVGTSQASTTVLGVELGTNGSLLGVRLVGDDARATIDKLVAPTEAYSRLSPLTISSNVVPALNISAPTIESRTPGGNPSVTTQSVNFANPAQGITVPAALASGVLNLGKLTSGIDAAGAHSALDSAIGNVNLAGIVSLSEVSNNLGTNAITGDADGVRSIKVGTLKVLDLGGLLDGLGLKLTDLPVSAVQGLLSQAGLSVPGLGAATTVNALIDGLQAQITAATATVTNSTGLPTAQVTSIVNGLGLGGAIDASTINAISDPVARANALVDQLQGVLADVLGDALKVLDGFTLLKVDGAEVGVNTKAVEALSDSSADVVAKIGSISVGSLTLPAVDLGAAAAQLNGLVSSVNDKLSQTLGSISPALANLVSVSVLDKTSSVTNDGGYNRARAGITAVTASIKPPVNLDAVVNTIKAATGAGDLIAQAGQSLPALSTAVSTVESTLGGAVQALAQGATIKVAEVKAASDFAAAAAPVSAPGGELPRTGGSTGLMAAVAAVMAGMAIAFRRFTRPVTR